MAVEVGSGPSSQVCPDLPFCAVCRRPIHLTKAQLIRSHGPSNNRCAGSGKPPAGLLPLPARSTAPPASSDVVSATAPGTLAPFRSATKILKRIPRASRPSAASKLAAILDGISASSDVDTWVRLFKFPSRCLRAPKRGGHRRSLVSVVNQQLKDEADPTPPLHLPSRGHPKSSHDPFNSLATRVAAKLEEGDYKGAVRLACSEDSIATFDEETMAALRSKHPPPHPHSQIPPPPPEDSTPSTTISVEAVTKAILSFPNGSAGGPDGLSPQHLKDLISASAEKGGRDLLWALTSFVNFVLSGKTPPPVRPTFFGASLIALRKKDGGIRPIAVGHTLRRLAAKCIGSTVLQSMGAYLAPLQLGYGTPSGAEAAAHAARFYLQNAQANHLMLKLDFKNAFNCLRRDKMLEAVRKAAPELLPFVHSAYEKSSSLFCGGSILLSQEGVQQGDPLGPLLFCLTIHPMVLQLRSEFRVFYMDDGTLGGSLPDVLEDLQLVESSASELGLQLNRSKSELICDDVTTREAMLSEVPGLQVLGRDRADILGSPIGSMEGISEAIQTKTDQLRLMGDRLHLLHSHDALLLLRHSFSIPKILYILRTAPCFLSASLEAYDNLLRAILSNISNVCLEEDSVWAQASLPVGAGGLGVRRAAQLAPSAFLASAAGCSELVNQILPSHLRGTPDPVPDQALSAWQQGHDETPPPGSVSHRQKAWDSPVISATYDSLLDASPDSNTRARLLAVATKESGAWLSAPPISSVGLRMDDEVIHVAVGLRLGVALCEPHQCRHCQAEVDHLGTHGLSCRFSRGRHARHAAINDIIKRSLDAAKIPSHLEPTGLYRSDGKRPDGASVVPWRGGKVLVWDATCPDTLAPSYANLAAREAGAVADEAERKKKAKYAHLESSHHFVPVAVETLGVLGSEARTLLRDLGRRLKDSTMEPLSHHYLLQRISVAVQRGNTAAILGSLASDSDSATPFFPT